MIQLIIVIYETGEWSKNFIKVIVIAPNKKLKATKFIDHKKISLIVHTTKIVTRTLRWRIGRKIKDAFGEYQFGFMRGKGTWDTIGMQRKISEQTLDMGDKLCTCSMEWQKATYIVNWPTNAVLMENGVCWHERKLIRKLYMNQSVKLWLYEGATESMKIGREVRKRRCLSPILFHLYSLPKMFLKDLDLQKRRRINLHCAKCR